MNGKIHIWMVILVCFAGLLETSRIKRQDSISDITDRGDGVKCVTQDTGQAGECVDITHCDEASKIMAANPNANQSRFIEQRACKSESGLSLFCCVTGGQSRTTVPQPARSPQQLSQPASRHELMTQDQLNQVCGVSSGQTVVRVVGRLPAALGQFPWMAAIFVGKELSVVSCGGVLINEQYVLTAAHCVVDKNTGLKRNESDYTVRLGALGISNDTASGTPEDMSVSQLIPHEDYNPATLMNDIALMRLDTPTSLTPICLPILPLMASSTFEDRKSIMAGWGREQQPWGVTNTALSYVALDVLSKTSCQTAFGRFRVTITDSHLCAGQTLTGNDACLGDEGGPLMLFHSDTDRWYSIGVKTVDFKCGETAFPDIFTRTTEYLDWIKRNANII